MIKKILMLLSLSLLAGCMTSQSFMPNMGQSILKEGKFIDAHLSDETGKVQPEKPSEKPETRPALNYAMVESEVLSNYLDGIKRKLLKHWPGEAPQDVVIYVTTNRAFAPYSTPWDIIIPMGVLGDVASEDELAFIIAHELSHILLHHHEVPEYFKNQEKVVDFASQTAMIATMVEGSEMLDKGNRKTIQLKDAPTTQRNIFDVYKTAMAVNSLSNDVINSFLSRQNEEEADLLGTDLIVRAGYSAYGYGKALERIESSLIFTKEQMQKEKTRYQTIVTTLSSDQIPTDGDLGSWLMYMAGNELVTTALQDLAELYYGPDKRNASLAAYLQREYQKERRRKLKANTLKEQAGWQVLTSYWDASEASRALDHGQVKTAEALVKKSVRGITKHHSYPREVFSSVRLSQGNLKKAAANLNMIKNWENASLDTVLKASRLNRKRKQYDMALKVLEKGGKALGAECSMYPEIITVYKEAGNPLKMESVLERCTAQSDSTIRNQCMTAAGKLTSSSRAKKTSTGFSLFDKLMETLPKAE